MSTTPAEYLAEWFARYTQNRDLILRKLSNVEHKDTEVIVTQKDGKVVNYHSEPFPADFISAVESISSESKGLLVYNTPENFQNLMKAWKKLADIPDLIIYFINPFSKTEKKWIIRPHIHAKISDPESLEMGMNSMYVMVDSCSQKEIEKLTQ